jgi:hypothetical protein
MNNDLVNGLFELLGAFLTWRNFAQLMRDREVKGVYWPTTFFFLVWGIWNLYYYPSLGQWLSFLAGIILCAGNAAWVFLAWHLYWMKRGQP